MTYPRSGDTIAVHVSGGWPTPTHILRAAEALDVISIPRIGDVLRAVAAGIENGPVVESKPWDAAPEGEYWEFALEGWWKPVLAKRTPKGWTYEGSARTLITRQILSGHCVWAPVVGSTPEGQNDA